MTELLKDCDFCGGIAQQWTTLTESKGQCSKCDLYFCRSEPEYTTRRNCFAKHECEIKEHDYNEPWKLGFTPERFENRHENTFYLLMLKYYFRRYKKHKDDSLLQQAEIIRLKQEHAKEIHEIYKPGGFGAKQAEQHFNEISEGL